jgi:hypothetical protein
MHDAFNTWFSSCHSSLYEVGEVQCLENAKEEVNVVYHAWRWHARGSDDVGSSTCYFVRCCLIM